MVTDILGSSVKEVLKVEANVRPGKEKGHEHFGFLDSISNPAIKPLTGVLPGQASVSPGVLVCGLDGDVDAKASQPVARPSWAKNGSFLVYRHLNQLVPEFNKFLYDNALLFPLIPRDQGSELLGARLVGRWKSGAPIDISPLQDNPALGADPQRNNHFDFSQGPLDQTRCPFAAHIRKTNPRADLPKPTSGESHPHAIMRQGIPFGPEVTPEEAEANETIEARGLSFVCYQSNLENGFEFVQKNWANTPKFPPKKINNAPFVSGFDPIIGQKNGQPREMAGVNASDQGQDLSLPIDFVVSKGGAYFFSPSISALKTKFAA